MANTSFAPPQGMALSLRFGFYFFYVFSLVANLHLALFFLCIPSIWSIVPLLLSRPFSLSAELCEHASLRPRLFTASCCGHSIWLSVSCVFTLIVLGHGYACICVLWAFRPSLVPIQ
ncbi:hypothetical protein AMTR_s00023p00252150 [Amborella trichopoda]|uniref:Uncharacterized protein n=1 Tax=Amborella trichopoda TaxID=13333 RepID=W1NKR0_AMBTC|nr:hypothetical protein AMTR_s00023p00252150 [Amborella trichopoda]